MQGYFHGELSCYDAPLKPANCPAFDVAPAAWEMGTTASCAGSGGFRPDFQMGGHNCEYGWWWFFGTHKYGKEGYWNSDTDWESNSDSFTDPPTHASIDRLSTGTCADYSLALTTILRKLGYSKNEIFSVQGEDHAYNLVKFPGETKWHYVDTVGNGGGVYGGAGFTRPTDAWYKYCTNMTDGCSNDIYSESRSTCPPNKAIFGCENVDLANAASVVPESAPELWPVLDMDDLARADQNCTELHPCTEESVVQVAPPLPSVNLIVTKTISAQEIRLGQPIQVTIQIQNLEVQDVNVTVQETFLPDVTYSLPPSEGAYEGYHFQYYPWSLTVPAQSTQTISFSATPLAVGLYSFMPTLVSSGASQYNATAPSINVVCVANSVCDSGENYLFCPADCSTGIQDTTCDMATDGKNDPDCTAGVDPDYNPVADTDGDSVKDEADLCPLTPADSVVDATGCACDQKLCADENSVTLDRCNSTTAACEYLPDADQDNIPDATDNCPAVPNSDQHDADGNGAGDACELGDIRADTILTPGIYAIADPDKNGALTINAPNIVLDCNGAEIIGNGSGYGIYVLASVNKVTIKNCNVRNYRYGIFLNGTFSNTVQHNTVTTNTYGIVLGAATGNSVINNIATENGYTGIYLEGSANNRIDANTATVNHGIGIALHTASNNQISGNHVCQNAQSDFGLFDSASTGDNNTCTTAGGWSDANMTGCTKTCATGVKVYLPMVTR